VKFPYFDSLLFSDIFQCIYGGKVDIYKVLSSRFLEDLERRKFQTKNDLN